MHTYVRIRRAHMLATHSFVNGHLEKYKLGDTEILITFGTLNA